MNREERNLANFFEMTEKSITNSFEVWRFLGVSKLVKITLSFFLQVDSVFFYATLSLVIMKPEDWVSMKIKFLKRVVLTAHARLVNKAFDKLKYLKL